MKIRIDFIQFQCRLTKYIRFLMRPCVHLRIAHIHFNRGSCIFINALHTALVMFRFNFIARSVYKKMYEISSCIEKLLKICTTNFDRIIIVDRYES